MACGRWRWCPSAVRTIYVIASWHQRAPSYIHVWGIRLAWVDEDRSGDRFLFIRNHSSKNPLVDMTTRFWHSWCCFLIQISPTFPTDLLTSWVPWLHVTSPRVSQVTSPRLSLVIRLLTEPRFLKWYIPLFLFLFTINATLVHSCFRIDFIKGTHPSVWHHVIPPSSCCPVSKYSVLFFKQSTVFNAFGKVSAKCGLRLKGPI